jgi:excisionase family DNA binding protein
MLKEIGGELFYTLDEIEDLLAMSPAALRDLIDQGKLKAKKIDNEWLIPEAALREYLDTKARQT